MPIQNHSVEGKFKKILISCEELKRESRNLLPFLEEIQHLEQERSLMDWEIVFLFVLLYLKHRSKKFVVQENPRALPILIESNQIQKSFRISDFSEAIQILFPDKEKCSTLFDYLLSKRFLKVPGEIKDCIIYWALGEYPLFLNHTVPTPMEVLQYQADGKRMVTLSYLHSMEGTLMPGNRDAFEFVLHDISHAFTFFNPYYDPKGQKNFFLNLTKKWTFLQPYLADSNFQKKIEYLISDMNSHPEHLKSYWRAILVESRKNRRNKKK